MDFPILKHLDTLIGLAVVMLIVSTVVVAITQFLMALSNSRSRYLRTTLSDLVQQIAPKLGAAEARYVAERLLRHPLVGRRRWLNFSAAANFGRSSVTKIAEWAGHVRDRVATTWPMPKVARGEVIMRHEIIATLLEWAAAEGALAQQDQRLARERPEVKTEIERITGALRAALAECGVADPAQAAREVRANLIEFEGANTGQPSQVWHTQALIRTNLGDLTGRVFAWYDNSMERVTEFFSLEAKVVTSLLALTLCVLIQLDSVDLLQRLSQDEKLRAALLAKAEVAKKSYEQVLVTIPATGDQKKDDDQRKEVEAKRTQAEQAIRESVVALRDPKAAVIPEYFLWQEVTQLQIDRVPEGSDDPPAYLLLRLDQREFKVEIPGNCLARFPECAAGAVQKMAAPVEVYQDPKGLTIVARSVDVADIQLTALPELKLGGALSRKWDCVGFWHRIPGVMLSWILVTLGAPFWYDFLKKLLGLRSILQSKDEAEREVRRGEQREAERVNDPGAVATAASPFESKAEGVSLERVVHLRSQPSMRAAVSRELPADWLVNVEGHLEAEPVRVGSGANAKWYRTVEGDYLWAGDVKGGQ